MRTNLTPRKLTEMSIEVMRQFFLEPRGNAKASPKVGAVLVKPDGTVETACRGELGYGIRGTDVMIATDLRTECRDRLAGPSASQLSRQVSRLTVARRRLSPVGQRES